MTHPIPLAIGLFFGLIGAGLLAYGLLGLKLHSPIPRGDGDDFERDCARDNVNAGAIMLVAGGMLAAAMWVV